MKFIKSIFFVPIYLFKMFIKGFNVLSLFLSRGFYFYLEKLFRAIEKVIPNKFNRHLIDRFEKLKEQPSHIVAIIVCSLCAIYIFDSIYIDNSSYVKEISLNDISSIKKDDSKKKVNKDENVLLNKELNLYRIYGKYSLNDIDFTKLKNTNQDTIAWLTVEGTTINYPIVQTSDNDYYLTHSYDKALTVTGCTFMYYTNNKMNDKNTIFYGHNLINNTSFGSLKKLFNERKSDINILVLTDDGKTYTYKVFSGYTIGPEVYYLRINFYGNDDYQKFLNTITSRNELAVSVPVTIDDSIITLSTCTDDNQGRRVIHAKLINIQ